MLRGVMCGLVLVAVVASAVSPSPAWAALSPRQGKCLRAIGKAGAELLRSKLPLFQRCRDTLLQGGSCAAPDAAVLAKIDESLALAIARACDPGPETFDVLGFPGPCTDADAGDGFTRDDVIACIRTSHDDIIAAMLALEYDAAVPVPLGKPELACQRTVAKRSGALVACVLRSVQKCRAAVMRGRLPGVPAHRCAIDDPRTASTIAKCQGKLASAVGAACSDAQATTLRLCEPNQSSVAGATSCLIDAHLTLTDGPRIDVPPDLIDYEFAVRGGLCGDGVVNALEEECDGSDDAACPGFCGAALEPDGYFACLCRNKPRLRVVEHAEADTDNGWTGRSADTGVVEGGGYLVDVYECDGSGTCLVGPRCSLPPHASCGVAFTAPSGTTGDSICAGLGQGVCRKERTAGGPHCRSDVQKKCAPDQIHDPVCDGPGDYCVVTPVSPPSPVFSGGVTVCNVTVWAEDVVGTANVSSGESIVRARQSARTHQNLIGAADKPCPVCGGFCAGSRDRCAVDGDCEAGAGPCVTVPVCSDGPNVDEPCRIGPPFGATGPFFGTTSVDCPPDPAAQIMVGGGLDLDIQVRTTGAVSMLPTMPCTGAGFTGDACVGGPSDGRPCTTASECPDGICTSQCFCPGELKPNDCAPACVGGTNDAGTCLVDSECPDGFCHAGDCRLDASDPGSAQEGVCTHGPADGRCSTTLYRACTADPECSQAACPFCQPGETCVQHDRACFVNSGIIRQGAPRTPEGVSVGIYCIPGNSPSVDTVAGFPGPAAFTQPELVLTVP